MPHVVTSVYLSNDPTYVTSYVPCVNPSRAPGEQRVGYLQEERQTTLEQVKALENIIESVNNKVDDAYWLWELYIIKFKRGICMMGNNINNF